MARLRTAGSRSFRRGEPSVDRLALDQRGAVRGLDLRSGIFLHSILHARSDGLKPEQSRIMLKTVYLKPYSHLQILDGTRCRVSGYDCPPRIQR